MPSGNIKESYIQFSNSAHQLFKQLIEPATQEIQDNFNLIIVPHEQLNFLPFEILLTEVPNVSNSSFGDLPYLLKKHSIHYASFS